MWCKMTMAMARIRINTRTRTRTRTRTCAPRETPGELRSGAEQEGRALDKGRKV